jgi:hypothetical protein
MKYIIRRDKARFWQYKTRPFWIIYINDDNELYPTAYYYSTSLIKTIIQWLKLTFL